VTLVVLAAMGKDPLGALAVMFEGGLGGRGPLGESLVKSSLLILTSLAVALPVASGLFNIGGQGQLLVGAITAAYLGRSLQLPALVHVTTALLGAALAASAYGALAGWLKAARGVHEVISTIMLNWLALHLIENWLVVGPLRAEGSGAEVSMPGTALIRDTARLPTLLEGSRLHAGVPLAFAVAVAVWILLTRTRLGFELRAIGGSPETARCSGIPVQRRLVLSMALAGACAGLAGGLLVLGTELRYPPHLSSPYGFDGIALSFIGANHPLGAVAAAMFFGVIRAGGTRLQLLHIHRDLPELIQGLTLLLVAGRAILAWALKPRLGLPRSSPAGAPDA
jgi:simple sugar transport system permease protein